MDEKAAFLAALKEHLEDETTRLVYADWLEDHDRNEEAVKQRTMAPGHRALALRGHKPRKGLQPPSRGDGPLDLRLRRAYENGSGCYEWWNKRDRDSSAPHRIAFDWFSLVESAYAYNLVTDPITCYGSKDFFTYDEAMDAAALAFAKLLQSRQDELLFGGHKQ